LFPHAKVEPLCPFFLREDSRNPSFSVFPPNVLLLAIVVTVLCKLVGCVCFATGLFQGSSLSFFLLCSSALAAPLFKEKPPFFTFFLHLSRPILSISFQAFSRFSLFWITFLLFRAHFVRLRIRFFHFPVSFFQFGEPFFFPPQPVLSEDPPPPCSGQPRRSQSALARSAPPSGLLPQPPFFFFIVPLLTTVSVSFLITNIGFFSFKLRDSPRGLEAPFSASELCLFLGFSNLLILYFLITFVLLGAYVMSDFPVRNLFFSQTLFSVPLCRVVARLLYISTPFAFFFRPGEANSFRKFGSPFFLRLDTLSCLSYLGCPFLKAKRPSSSDRPPAPEGILPCVPFSQIPFLPCQLPLSRSFWQKRNFFHSLLRAFPTVVPFFFWGTVASPPLRPPRLAETSPGERVLM